LTVLMALLYGIISSGIIYLLWVNRPYYGLGITDLSSLLYISGILLAAEEKPGINDELVFISHVYLFEVSGTTCMKLSYGFTRRVPKI
jgi:hypothetical protein